MPKPEEKSRAPEFDHGGFWDSYAAGWDQKVRRPDHSLLGEEWGSDAQARLRIQEFVEPYLASNALVAEIGPGGGKYSRHLSALARELVLLDVSEQMLARARAVCGDNTRTQRIDGTSLLPLESAAFDAVLSFDVFIHLESEEIFRYLGEANRVLKVGGLVVLSSLNLLSLHGGLAYFRQIRDRLPMIGQRYGGRIYPLDGRIFRWLAEQSGFEVLKEHDNWEDTDLFISLAKRGPPMPWRYAIEADLRERYELGARVAGDLVRPVYIGTSHADGCLALVLTEDAPRDLPKRAPVRKESPCVPAPDRDEVHAHTRVRTYPRLRGMGATMLGRSQLKDLVPKRSFESETLSLLAEVDAALASGRSAPGFTSHHVFLDVERQRFIALGFEGAGARAGTDRARILGETGAALLALSEFVDLGEKGLAAARSVVS